MHHSNVGLKMGETVTHVIIVCCHAIWRGRSTSGQDESEWYVVPKTNHLALPFDFNIHYLEQLCLAESVFL